MRDICEPREKRAIFLRTLRRYDVFFGLPNAGQVVCRRRGEGWEVPRGNDQVNSEIGSSTYMKATENIIKALDISIAVLFVVFLATSHFDVPPASFFIGQYCKLFDTNKYSPMLIGALMTLAVALPIYGLKLYLKRKPNG